MNLFTKPDVAKMLGCSLQTVHRLIKRGELNPTRIGVRLVRITSQELNRYLSINIPERNRHEYDLENN